MSDGSMCEKCGLDHAYPVDCRMVCNECWYEWQGDAYINFAEARIAELELALKDAKADGVREALLVLVSAVRKTGHAPLIAELLSDKSWTSESSGAPRDGL